MRKKNQSIDVEALDQKIKDELGLDISKYNNPRIVESLVELLTIPYYLRYWVIRPIFLSIAAYVLGYYTFELTRFEYAFYGILGLLFFLTTGFLLAMLLLTFKLKNSILEIINFIFDILQSSVEDLHQVGSQVNLKNSPEVLGLLFTGITHIIIIPILADHVAGQVPVVGRFVTRFISRVLTHVASTVSFESVGSDLNFGDASDESRILGAYANAIQSVVRGTNRVLNFTMGIAQ
ncbi:MAG: hypothetical protein AAF902_16230, partial [Chloroflexota bacterium]